MFERIIVPLDGFTRVKRVSGNHSFLFVLLLVLALVSGGCGDASGPEQAPTSASTPPRELTGTISEFSLPVSRFHPGDITSGSDGNLWFTALAEKTPVGIVERITPQGAVKVIPLPSGSFSNSITSGPDGNLWIKEPGKIGRITTTGTISEFPLSSSTNVDTENWPATLYGGTLWGDITTGPDHAVWFTEPSLSASENGKIGRITTTGTISEFPVPDPLCNVNGITAGPDNTIWFTEDTTNHNEKGKIGRVTLTGAISEFPLPTPSGGPGGIIVGPDSNLWFTEMLGNKIGRLT